MLEPRVLALSILSNDAEIHVLMSCLVSRDILDQHDRSVDIQLLSQRNVERLVTGALDRCVQDTLQTEFVSPEGGDGFAEEFFGVLAASVYTGHIHLLPFHGYIVGFEDGLHGFGNFSTNAVT